MMEQITGLLLVVIFTHLQMLFVLKLSLQILSQVDGLAQIGHFLAEQHIQQVQP
jgi:hypothetical protein